MKKLIIGNWKMNGDIDSARSLIADTVNALFAKEELLEGFDFVVCPPSLHISAVRHALLGYPKVAFGGQDCAAHDNGAHTGDISASMLKDAGCSYVIVGHSERRTDHNESDESVKAKASAAIKNDLIPIICVGETLAQRESGEALSIVETQIKNSIPALETFHSIVIAYEPVWAIGTGKVPSLDDIAQMHAHIRGLVGDKPPILYGGSLKPDNARDILAIPNVNGGLIGGASLNAESFIGIAKAV